MKSGLSRRSVEAVKARYEEILYAMSYGEWKSVKTIASHITDGGNISEIRLKLSYLIKLDKVEKMYTTAKSSPVFDGLYLKSRNTKLALYRKK